MKKGKNWPCFLVSTTYASEDLGETNLLIVGVVGRHGEASLSLWRKPALPPIFVWSETKNSLRTVHLERFLLARKT